MRRRRRSPGCPRGPPGSRGGRRRDAGRSPPPALGRPAAANSVANRCRPWPARSRRTGTPPRRRSGCAPATAGPGAPSPTPGTVSARVRNAGAGGALGRAVAVRCDAESACGAGVSDASPDRHRRRRAGRARAPGSGSPACRQRLVELRRGRGPARRTGRAGAGAAAPVRRRPGCPRRQRAHRHPRQAAWATAVRATTRSARIPSTSNAAHSAAIRRNSLSRQHHIGDPRARRGDPPRQLGVLPRRSGRRTPAGSAS